MRLIYYDVGTGFLADAHKYHAIDELNRSGHDVVYVNPAQAIGENPSADRCSEHLLDRVREERDGKGLDMLFSVAWDSGLEPGAIDDIRRMGIPTVSFSSDDLSHPYRVRTITPHFDLCWTSARESTGILKGYGARKVVAMPFAANPYFFKPTGQPERSAVGFVGTAYGARAHSIASLAQAGIPVEVHGASPMDIYGTSKSSTPFTRALSSATDGWGRFVNSIGVPGGRKCIYGALKRTVLDIVTDPPEKRPMDGAVTYLGAADYDEMVGVLSESAISLGSIEVASTYVLKNPLLFIRFREFEAAMAGGVHLVNRFPELEEYFEEDREMLYYGSTEELIDKARFYLAPERAAKRQEIRENAAARARAGHTWLHRFQRLWDDLGLRVE